MYYKLNSSRGNSVSSLQTLTSYFSQVAPTKNLDFRNLVQDFSHNELREVTVFETYKYIEVQY
jgi:hypothetical protein